MPTLDDSALSAASHYKATECEYYIARSFIRTRNNLAFLVDGNDDPYDMKIPACKAREFSVGATSLTMSFPAQVYVSIQKRYSVKNQARMEKPHGVDRIKVPLPKDLDPRVRIDLKNRLTGEIGFQLIKAGNTRAKRLDFLNNEIEGCPETIFPLLTYVDRAMVSPYTLFSFHSKPARPIYLKHTRAFVPWTMRAHISAAVHIGKMSDRDQH